MPIERAFAAGFLGLLVPLLTACSTLGSSSTPSTALRPASSPRFGSARNASFTFKFTTIDDQTNPIFNEILGLNDGGKLAGFYGNGSVSNPNQGYVVDPPYQQTNFRSYNYPNASDTQVTSLNDKKTVVGFYRDAKNNVRGFVNVEGIWTNYRHPHGLGEGKSVTELLGVNSSDLAVGFYTNASGVNEAFSLNLVTGKVHAIDPPGGTNAVATSIAGRGDIVGYFEKNSQLVGFLLRLGTFTEFTYPGATDTKFLGVTVYDQIVGSYVDSGGSTHGFLLTEPLKPSIAWQQVDEPNAVGTSVVSGINQSDDIAGYYVDSAGNTNGFFATLASPSPR
jgi:hypothetical protein